MIEAERRRLGNAELAAGEQPAMSGDHLAVAINQDRDNEAKDLDAVSDLPDLLLAVQAGIGWIRLQVVNPAIDDRESRRNACAYARSGRALHSRTLLGLSRGADRAIAETWFCESQQPKSANPPPSLSGGRIPAEFYFAILGERRPCFLQPTGANWSRTARTRALVTRAGNCCLAASQSASPEEVSRRALNSATRRSYHMCRSRSDSGEAPFVDNLNRAPPAVGLPAASDNGSRLASSCLATSPATAHSRITSSRQNSMSFQASRYFDSERNSTGECSWSSARAAAR